MWESLQVEENSFATCKIGMWKGTPIPVSILSAKIKVEIQLAAACFV
jgi:hypothetical protein